MDVQSKTTPPLFPYDQTRVPRIENGNKKRTACPSWYAVLTKNQNLFPSPGMLSRALRSVPVRNMMPQLCILDAKRINRYVSKFANPVHAWEYDVHNKVICRCQRIRSV